jgi:hypothetical protein
MTLETHPDGEAESPRWVAIGFGLENHIGGGVVGVRVHGIGTILLPGGGEADVLDAELGDAEHPEGWTGREPDGKSGNLGVGRLRQRIRIGTAGGAGLVTTCRARLRIGSI